MADSKKPGKPKRPRPQEDDYDEDDYDDAPRPKGKRNRSGVESIIPYKNGTALGAYYCGVFGLIPIIGFLLGIVAIVLGILGLKKASKFPEAGGKGHAITGIILGVVDLVLWPAVGLALRFLAK